MVVIKDFTNMFWGVTIDGGKRYSQRVEKSFHISMAALEPSSAKGCVSLMIQHEKAEFLLCSLDTKHHCQQALDLNFREGEEVTLFLTGTGIVHLTGYLMDMEEFDDDAQSMDSDDYNSSEDYDDEETPELVPVQYSKTKSSDLKRKLADTFKELKMKKKKNEHFDDDSEEEDSEEEDEQNFMDDEALEDSEEEQEEPSEEDEESEEEVVKKTPSSSKKSAVVSKQEKQKETPKNKSKVSTPKAALSSSKSPMPKTPQSEAVSESGDTTEGKKKKKKKKKKKNKGGEEGTPTTDGEGDRSKSQEKATPQKKVVAGGTVVEEIRVGHGPEAKPGKMVHVYYSGKLTSGKQFDSCLSGKPFRFKLGKQEVIKGWDNGVTGMKVGGKRRLTVPATQGYGNQRQGPIPPNSTLMFEVELKAVS